jgi:hypothetical protein
MDAVKSAPGGRVPSNGPKLLRPEQHAAHVASRNQDLMEKSTSALYQALLDSFSGPGNADEATTAKYRADLGRCAEQLLRRVRPPEFDLRISKQESFLLQCVQKMSPKVWPILQQHAMATNGLVITSVALSEHVDVDSKLVRGLAALGVEHLSMQRTASLSLLKRLETLTSLRYLSCWGDVKGLPEDIAKMLKEGRYKSSAVVGTAVAALPPPPSGDDGYAPGSVKDMFRQRRAEGAPFRRARTALHCEASSAQPEDVKLRELADRLLETAVTNHPPPGKVDSAMTEGLNRVVMGSYPIAARGITDSILRAPEQVLNPDRKLALLMARLPATKRRTANTRSMALPPQMRERGEKLAFRMEQNKLLPRKVFLPALAAFVEEQEVMPGHDEYFDDATELHAHPPLLSRLCGELDPISPMGQYAFINLYLCSVLDSNLPIEHKAEICASIHMDADGGEFTAAQRALREGHPTVATIFLLAVMESGLPPNEIRELENVLGVTREQIVGILKEQAKKKVPQAAILLQRIKKAVAGLELLEGDRRVDFRVEPTNDGLIAERMWTRGTGTLLCSAPREIAVLQFSLVPEEKCAAFAAPGRYYYAIDPLDLVKAVVPDDHAEASAGSSVPAEGRFS